MKRWIRLIRMIIAFRQCGLVNAWRMAREMSELICDESDLETVRLKQHQ